MYTLKEIAYTNRQDWLTHTCQICNKPLVRGEPFIYLSPLPPYPDANKLFHKWACSIECANLICLCDGDTNYAGYNYEGQP